MCEAYSEDVCVPCGRDLHVKFQPTFLKISREWRVCLQIYVTILYLEYVSTSIPSYYNLLDLSDQDHRRCVVGLFSCETYFQGI